MKLPNITSVPLVQFRRKLAHLLAQRVDAKKTFVLVHPGKTNESASYPTKAGLMG